MGALNSDDDFGEGNEVAYYHTNTLFSVYALSDANESVIERYRYDAAACPERSRRGACTVLDESREEYNERRPHSGLNWRTPAAFAESLAGPPVGAPPSLRPSQGTNSNRFSHITWYENRGGVNLAPAS